MLLSQRENLVLMMTSSLTMYKNVAILNKSKILVDKMSTNPARL